MVFTWALPVLSGRILASEWLEPLAGLLSWGRAQNTETEMPCPLTSESKSGKISVGLPNFHTHTPIPEHNSVSLDLWLAQPQENMSVYWDESGLRRRGPTTVHCDEADRELANLLQCKHSPRKALECLCSGSWSTRSAGGQGRWYTSESRLTSQH